MARTARHGAHVDASGEEAGGEEVAQVVQADTIEAELVAKVPEGPTGRVRPPWLPAIGFVAEHVRIGAYPVAGPASSLLGAAPMCP